MRTVGQDQDQADFHADLCQYKTVIDPARAKLAQGLAGGLIWFSTKTRPDITHTISRFSNCVSRDPGKPWCVASGGYVICMGLVRWVCILGRAWRAAGKCMLLCLFLFGGEGDSKFEALGSEGGMMRQTVGHHCHMAIVAASGRGHRHR